MLRQVTHECQRPPEVLRRETIDFINFVKPNETAINCCECLVINMDQTPIFFDMSLGKNLSQAGARTADGRTSLSATLQVTVVVTVTASGGFLCPLVVFKGKPGARTETRDFPAFPPENLYACQERAWMDKRGMRIWVYLVLKPYVETALVTYSLSSCLIPADAT